MSNRAHGAAGEAGQTSDGRRRHGSFQSYAIGFALSIVLTVIPLLIVTGGWLGRTWTVFLILAAAVLQFAVQLLFFMHVREGDNARWNGMALLLGLLIMVTIVGGSIWIMTYNAVAQ